MRRRNKDFRNLVGDRVKPSNELGADMQSWKKSVYNGSSQPGCGRGSLGMENTAQERSGRGRGRTKKAMSPGRVSLRSQDYNA